MANRCQVSIHSIAKEAFKANYLIVLDLLWGFDICLRFIIFTHYHFQYNLNNGILSNDLEFMCQSGLVFGFFFFFFFHLFKFLYLYAAINQPGTELCLMERNTVSQVQL